MSYITPIEAIFGLKGLKQIREENNINVPDEYVQATSALAFSLCAWVAFGAFLLGIIVGGLLL